MKKILFIRNDRIGDFLLNLPAIHALKETFPAAEISVVIHPVVQELMSHHPDISKLIPFQLSKDLSWKDWKRLYHELKKEKYDLAIVSNPHKYFHLLTAILRIPRRIGYHRKWGFFLTDAIEDRKAQNNRHEVEYNLDLVSLIGAKLKAPFSEDTYRIYLTPEEEKLFLKFMEERCVSSVKGWIIIHPFTTDPKKEWPMQMWAELLNRLTEWNVASGNPFEMILIGSEEEKLQSEILSKTRSLKNLVGRLTLRQLAALLKKATLLVSNDSGPVHIAAAFQTETIVLFGGELSRAKRWGPWSVEQKKRHTIIQGTDIKDIPVETVWKEVIQKFRSSS